MHCTIPVERYSTVCLSKGNENEIPTSQCLHGQLGWLRDGNIQTHGHTQKRVFSLIKSVYLKIYTLTTYCTCK